MQEVKPNWKRVVKAVARNIIWLTLLYFALIKQNPNALNLIIFWTWLGLFVNLCLAYNDKLRKEEYGKGRALPAFIFGIITLTTICAFVWYGKFLLATAYLISSAAYDKACDKPEEKEKSEEEEFVERIMAKK